VVLHAFQMLCPGCVLGGTPQAQRLHDAFAGSDLAVIGLHTVFEHHEAMGPESLAAYVHEFGLTFPIGIDRHDGTSPSPCTMRAYGMRGTPTLVLLDRSGRIRHHRFGHVDDLWLGREVGRLLDEPAASDSTGPPGRGTLGP
jgi:hypothetical protein